ncbi:hypothetical protein BUALT_Bualt10G0013200 [Buddleja alternifolia]|uniref:TmcB/TmcC TPR repeats domain-containing protein n=1 Tax=Buddleja alternifolia TaxID=168488 RepID=A0AAV6WV84_9LAMI|nr:hypothetical protein BUALT_Bualt10G0013200 [Buddleja alternifolia]
MKSMLLRTGSGSIPVQTPLISGSPTLSVTLPVHETSVAGEKNSSPSPRLSLHLGATRRSIRRSSSESDVVIRSELKSLSRLRSRSFPAMIPEADEYCLGSLTLKRGYAGELGFDGGGMNKNGVSGGGGNGSDGDDGYKIGAYYQQMLQSNPTNPLILRNYAKYLHEVERDVVKAEEYYGRAILASGGGDGELLCLYGKLIWETYKDESRAKSYFQQALHASPHDCTVLGSYGQFLWEAEGDEDEEMERANEEVVSAAAMIEAF